MVAPGVVLTDAGGDVSMVAPGVVHIVAFGWSRSDGRSWWRGSDGRCQGGDHTRDHADDREGVPDEIALAAPENIPIE
jgi:hypothetical protein